MYLVAIAWIYVVLMMAIAEATASNGTILGAIVTFFLYGVLPTVILMYIMGTPMRRKALRAQEQAELAALRAQVAASGQPDAGSETPADAVTTVREKF
jgi:mannose/fructose/N-acetylgalactosamine-specific phosphotransferase system component IID